MIFYFAYGSNQDEDQMRARCPDSKFVGKFVLKDYRLAFSIFSPKRQCGCADIIKSPGDEVWGLVYEISPADLERLDEFEAHPEKYKRFTTSVENERGEKQIVEAYEVVEKSVEHLPPSKEYFGIITRAAEIYNFPESYKKFLTSFKILS